MNDQTTGSIVRRGSPTAQAQRLGKIDGFLMEAYAYRTSSRFGSRVTIGIDQGVVTVTGPRVGIGLYRLWVGIQALLLTLAAITLLAGALFRDWHYLVWFGVLLACHACTGGFGAGCLWELENLIEFGAGVNGKSASFPLHEVKRVRVGRGWARRGMWLLILPYIAAVNKMSKGMCVSFEAPDGERDSDVVYALHMRSIEEASRLAGLLERKEELLSRVEQIVVR